MYTFFYLKSCINIWVAGLCNAAPSFITAIQMNHGASITDYNYIHFSPVHDKTVETPQHNDAGTNTSIVIGILSDAPTIHYL